MLDNAYNHAGIIAWGWFNEGPSDEPGACPAYAENAARVRERDPARFGTWADHKVDKSACLQHADLISFNNYPGWYGTGPPGDLDLPEQFWKEQARKVATGTTASGAGTRGKPFTISETGGAGIYEWHHNDTAIQWTLAYQNDLIWRDVSVALTDSSISGIALWHFYDFKVQDSHQGKPCLYVPNTFPPDCSYIEVKVSGSHGIRPGGYNHKGVLDFWRRPKPAFHTVAHQYHSFHERYHPMVARSVRPPHRGGESLGGQVLAAHARGAAPST